MVNKYLLQSILLWTYADSVSNLLILGTDYFSLDLYIMWFSKKPITFVKKASIITRNQRSLFKIVRNILLEEKHDVMYARPAYHVFDVDESTNSKSNIKKGREMVGRAYLDIIIVENESLRAVCAFRMDDNGDKKASEWSKETRNLVMAAESAKFPLFVVPNAKAYSTSAIIAQLKKIIPVSKFASQHRATAKTVSVPVENDEFKERDVEHKRRSTSIYHKTRP